MRVGKDTISKSIDPWRRRLEPHWASLRRILISGQRLGTPLSGRAIEFLRAYPIRIAAVVAVLLLLYAILTHRSIAIQPISVPRYLQENGYTANIAAIRLRDALVRFAEKANMIRFAERATAERATMRLEPPQITLRDDLPDFVVPTVGISFATITTYIRTFFF